MRTADNRERILDAAVELIARDGFDGVRLAEIAKRARASTALIHYHFATRSQLLAEAIAHSLDREEARIRRHTDNGQQRLSPPERLADLVDFWLPLTPEDTREWLLWGELESRAARSPELGAALTGLYTRLTAPFAAAVREGVDRGLFAPCDPDEVTLTTHALLAGLATRLLAHDAALTLPRARRLAGRHVAEAVGHPGELPFATREVPDRAPAPDLPPARPRRRAAKT